MEIKRRLFVADAVYRSYGYLHDLALSMLWLRIVYGCDEYRSSKSGPILANETDISVRRLLSLSELLVSNINIFRDEFDRALELCINP